MIYYHAPAKINRFLRIVKQEADGYHYLQTIFQFTNLYDEIGFKRSDEHANLNFHYEHNDFTLEEDLIYRAIQCLQPYNRKRFGVDIDLKKHLPMGGGLGGGSSNAATTLIVLNQLWELNLSKEILITIGRSLGADIPIFIHGEAAWAEGRGDQFTAIDPGEERMLLIIPNISISTKTIFSSPSLSRHNQPLSSAIDFNTTINDCLSAIFYHYPLMKLYIESLEKLDLKPQITGTGSSIFIRQSNINTQNRVQLEKLAQEYRWQLLPFETLNENLIYHKIKIEK